MPETISGRSRLRISVASAGTNELASQSASITRDIRLTFPNGTDDDDIDSSFSDEGTLEAATPISYDLDAGALDGPLGTEQTFAEVVQILVRNTGDTNDMEVKGNFLGDEIRTIPPGGLEYLYFGPDGDGVTAATKDTITIESTLGTDYEVLVTGRSA